MWTLVTKKVPHGAFVPPQINALYRWIPQIADDLDKLLPWENPFGWSWRDKLVRRLSDLRELWSWLSPNARRAWFVLVVLGIEYARPGGYTLNDFRALSGVTSRASARRVVARLANFGVLKVERKGQTRYCPIFSLSAQMLRRASNEFHRRGIRSQLKEADSSVRRGKESRGTSRGWEPVLGGMGHLIAEPKLMPPDWAVDAFEAALSIGLDFFERALGLPGFDHGPGTQSEAAVRGMLEHLGFLRDSLKWHSDPEHRRCPNLVRGFTRKYNGGEPSSEMGTLLQASTRTIKADWAAWQRRLRAANRGPVLLADVVDLLGGYYLV
jgi:hypothetical protein